MNENEQPFTRSRIESLHSKVVRVSCILNNTCMPIFSYIAPAQNLEAFNSHPAVNAEFGEDTVPQSKKSCALACGQPTNIIEKRWLINQLTHKCKRKDCKDCG